MAKKEAPMYVVCGIRLTVKHIVTEFLKYKMDRQRIGTDVNLDTALGHKTENNLKIINLKATNLYT